MRQLKAKSGEGQNGVKLVEAAGSEVEVRLVEG